MCRKGPQLWIPPIPSPRACVCMHIPAPQILIAKASSGKRGKAKDQAQKKAGSLRPARVFFPGQCCFAFFSGFFLFLSRRRGDEHPAGSLSGMKGKIGSESPDLMLQLRSNRRRRSPPLGSF